MIRFCLVLLILSAVTARAKHHGGKPTTSTLRTTTTSTLSTTTIVVTTTTLAVTTTLLVTTTTTLAETAANVVTRDPDGATRWLKACDDLPSWRGRAVAARQMMCGRNGDIYYSDVACQTGATRPTGLPWILGAPYQGFPVPSGSIIYPGRYGGDAPGWQYRATSPTGAGVCVLGAKPPAWCRTAGCTVTSGSCLLTAQPYAAATLAIADGSCVWKNGGADIGSGGGWGPTAGYEEGKGFPLVGHQVSTGDNNMRYAYQGGRMEYGGIDETTFAAGAGGNFFGSAPGTYVAAGYPGFGIMATPTLGIATAPPLVLTPIAGTEAPGSWGCYGLAWQNTLGGRTRMGPQTLTCASLASGGLNVAQPNRDGWVWPTPFPVGGVIGVVFRMVFPSAPCTPLPGQTQCQPLLPKEAFLQFFDYLYGPTDSLNQVGQGTPERGGGTDDVNSSGFPISPFVGYEHSIGIGALCIAGATGFTPGGNCVLQPSNGWWYAIVGDKCIEPFGPGKGAHCDDSLHYVTLPNPLPPQPWRTDQMPFCAGGVCFRRSIPEATGQILHENGYTGGWVFRIQRGATDIAGFRNGNLEFYGPGGVLDVRLRCGATAVNGAPGCGP